MGWICWISFSVQCFDMEERADNIFLQKKKKYLLIYESTLADTGQLDERACF